MSCCNKMASTAEDFIAKLLSTDPSVGFSERVMLQQGVRRLGAADLARLISILRTAGSAGVGALIARFLLDKGRAGMLLGAVTGGLIGAGLSDTRTKNKLGERVHLGVDVYNQPFRRL